MGTLGVELGMGERFNNTSYPASAAAKGGNSIGITPFYDAFLEEQVLVHLLNHDNTDIDYHILVVPRNHLCKGTSKSLFYAIICLILFAAS